MRAHAWRLAAALLLMLLGLGLGCGRPLGRGEIRVASKPFTESYLLSEMIAQLVDATGEARAVRRFGMGGPLLVMGALRAGDLDVDVNYTGALMHLFMKDRKEATLPELQAALARQGIALGGSLGFNNTYAIAVRSETARRLGLRTISDLRGHPELRGAFTPDFLNHDDGFYKLQEVYGVRLASIKPMQHALSYPALAHGEIDLTDAYTTDGTLPEFDLTLLTDDRDFFPKYYGVVTARAELLRRFPRTWAALARLEGKLSDARMTELNRQVDVRKRPIAEVARGFLVENGLAAAAGSSTAGGRFAGIDDGLWVSTYEHFLLVTLALLASCLLGIPVGILAVQYRRTGQVLIAATGLLQTVPSLALLCFLIPLFGIGALPTVFALFLYGLLPIAQSTAAGLLSLDERLVETAKSLGLSRLQRLRLIELPLASRYILSGVKTTAVINVGTATIAAFIGAGGYGRYITSGLAMNDVATILKGAIPTALMAVFFHGLFELLSRWAIPYGLRLQPDSASSSG